jgi:hypothetical protein
MQKIFVSNGARMLDGIKQVTNSLGSLHGSLDRPMSQWKANGGDVSHPSPLGESDESRAFAPLIPWTQGGGWGVIPLLHPPN